MIQTGVTHHVPSHWQGHRIRLVWCEHCCLPVAHQTASARREVNNWDVIVHKGMCVCKSVCMCVCARACILSCLFWWVTVCNLTVCDCVHSSVHFRTLGRAKLAQVSRKSLISKQTNKQKHRAPLEAEPVSRKNEFERWLF